MRSNATVEPERRRILAAAWFPRKDNSISLNCLSFFASISPDLCRAVDHYCERTGDAWNAEPINAVTNVAFLIAGWAAWRLADRRSALDGDRLLAAVIAVIPVVGFGSFTFHTLATRWAEWVDVIPIMVFMLLYLWLTMSRFFGWPVLLKLAMLSAFFLATFTLEASVPGTVFWGGAMYLPTTAAFLAMGLAPSRSAVSGQSTFLLAAAVFVLSFTLRTLDASLCANLSFGTHFLWHILNAALLYLLARTAILHSPSAQVGATSTRVQ